MLDLVVVLLLIIAVMFLVIIVMLRRISDKTNPIKMVGLIDVVRGKAVIEFRNELLDGLSLLNSVNSVSNNQVERLINRKYNEALLKYNCKKIPK